MKAEADKNMFINLRLFWMLSWQLGVRSSQDKDFSGRFAIFATPCLQDWCTKSGVPNAPPKMQAGASHAQRELIWRAAKAINILKQACPS